MWRLEPAFAEYSSHFWAETPWVYDFRELGSEGQMLTISEYNELLSALSGDVVAIRSRTRLQPAGGVGDKVFPPTYAGDSSDTKYACEPRASNGKETVSVLLDSVASQANRAELALLDAHEQGIIKFPVPYIDFSDSDVIREFDKLTVLEVPHRIADAIFRDSLLDGQPFRSSDIGRSITDASPRNASALYRYAPSALVFGVWDSTGPKGGLGSKFQRAYVSEIVGHEAQFGVSVGSRLDPLKIGLLPQDQLIFNHQDETRVWTLDEANAQLDNKNKPKAADRGSGEGKAGQPSKINHGNVTPTRNIAAGGITMAYAEQTSVFSLATIRKLRFDGYSVDQTRAAQAALIALGVVAMKHVWNSDFDLRSRCLLIPEERPVVELLRRDGSIEPNAIDFTQDAADKLLEEATSRARDLNVGWEENEIALQPSDDLLELMRRSQSVRRSEIDDHS